MIAWRVYDLATGLFTGEAFDVQPFSLAQVARNTPAGCGVRWGDYDPRSQMVDLASGEVVARELEVPSEAARLAFKRQEVRGLALGQIEALEALQARPLREVGLAQVTGQPAPTSAVDRLRAAETAILVLRATVAQIEAAQSMAELEALEVELG